MSTQTDEVGTGQLPFDDDSKRAPVHVSPTCGNCGWMPEAATEPIPNRCPMCWARLGVVT
jgi:hypothetical protein